MSRILRIEGAMAWGFQDLWIWHGFRVAAFQGLEFRVLGL